MLDLADRRSRQIRQQLGQVALGIDVMPAAGAGQAGKDRSSLAARSLPTHDSGSMWLAGRSSRDVFIFTNSALVFPEH